ncbi:unnamed protein product [Closterium sp. Naga37s-1]|nr:unnamed protein product [Closterium sp. Naga37s-1]
MYVYSCCLLSPHVREALAAKDAAEAVPELFMVDDVIRGFADLIGRSNVKYDKFQNIQQIDVTLVAHIVQQTRLRLKNRYFNRSPDHQFGGGEKMTLNDFITHHQKMDKREVKAEGVDSDGEPVSFEYTLHERKIKGHKSGGDVTACFELSLKFVRAVDSELEWRMRDLEHLEGTKLFRSASYVADDE